MQQATLAKVQMWALLDKDSIYLRSSKFKLQTEKERNRDKMSLVKHKACPCPVDGASYVPGVKHFLNQNDTQDIAGFV